jgi:predicted DNA binding CopG/RHH family protein
MATAAQIAANRLNAAHSTGPRTPEGKARAAENALRHGLTATNLVIAPGQQEQLESLRAALFEELDPQGITEVLTFNEILHAAWNLHRFRIIEAQHAAGPDALDDPAKAAFLDRLGRYQARAQRAYFRALNELRTLQTNRTLRSVKLTEEEEREVPVLADVNELTKQTHSEVTAEALRLADKMINIEIARPRIEAARARPVRPPKTPPCGSERRPPPVPHSPEP